MKNIYLSCDLCLYWSLTSQSTIFQSCRDGATASWVINQYFRGVKCLAQGHNTAAVGFEPPTSRSGVRHSTTEPPRSPVMWSIRHLGVEQCQRQPIMFFVYWRLLTQLLLKDNQIFVTIITAKPTKWYVPWGKTQISLHICAVYQHHHWCSMANQGPTASSCC